MIKKIVSICMTLSLMLSIIPAPAFASVDPQTISQFAKRNSKGNITVLGDRFYAAGANAHWLGTVSSGTAYPTNPQVDALFDGLNTMISGQGNGVVVRSITLASSFGCPACIEPTVGTFNQAALDHFDYVIYSARKRGVKLILTFADEKDAVDGSEPGTRQDWVDAFGGGSPDRFFTDANIRSAFLTYVDTILNHQENCTGLTGCVSYQVKNDPIIYALETGNEMDQSDTKPCSSGTTNTTDCDFTWTSSLRDWTRAVVNNMTTVDPNHLIIDGHHFSQHKTLETNISNDEVSTPGVDIFQVHMANERDVDFAEKIAKKARNNNRAFIAGEFAWQTGDQWQVDSNSTLDKYVKAVDAAWCNKPDGALFWEATVDNRLINQSINVQTTTDPDQISAINTMKSYWTTPISNLATPGNNACP